MKIAETVYNGILPLFKGDIQLVDVEYVKRNDGMHLIIYIDKENGVMVMYSKANDSDKSYIYNPKDILEFKNKISTPA